MSPIEEILNTEEECGPWTRHEPPLPVRKPNTREILTKIWRILVKTSIIIKLYFLWHSTRRHLRKDSLENKGLGWNLGPPIGYLDRVTIL